MNANLHHVCVYVYACVYMSVRVFTFAPMFVYTCEATIKTHIELKARVTRPFSISYWCRYIQVILKAGNPGSKQTRYITYVCMN